MHKTSKITQRQLFKKILKNLSPIGKRSFLEQYAIFMGKVQIVELRLQGLLIKEYSYKESMIEKYTLGRVINELKKNNFRKDFTFLLEDLLVYRNSLAHKFLSLTIMGNKLVHKDFERLQYKELKHALFSVEQVIQVYDFLF